MKKSLLIIAVAAASLFVSCQKEEPLAPVDQKDRLEEISKKMNSILDDSEYKQAVDIADYYRENLSSLSKSQVVLKVGNVMSIADGIFSAIPDTKSGISMDWSYNGRSACFKADMKGHRWEYIGEGDGDGVHFLFLDGDGNDCSLDLSIADKRASVDLVVNDREIASCVVGYEKLSFRQRNAYVYVTAGPVVSSTELRMDNGIYSMEETVTHNGANIVNCLVSANGLLTESDGLISGFGKFNVDVNVLDELFVDVDCGASFSDIIHGIDFSKDYAERLQNSLDRYVDARVYFTNGGTVQSEIKFDVDKKGLFGAVTVRPYIYFESDGTTCEFDEYFDCHSVLPELFTCLENLFGGWRISF